MLLASCSIVPKTSWNPLFFCPPSVTVRNYCYMGWRAHFLFPNKEFSQPAQAFSFVHKIISLPYNRKSAIFCLDLFSRNIYFAHFGEARVRIYPCNEPLYFIIFPLNYYGDTPIPAIHHIAFYLMRVAIRLYRIPKINTLHPSANLDCRNYLLKDSPDFLSP